MFPFITAMNQFMMTTRASDSCALCFVQAGQVKLSEYRHSDR